MKPNEHYMDYTGSSVYCQSQIEQVGLLCCLGNEGIGTLKSSASSCQVVVGECCAVCGLLCCMEDCVQLQAVRPQLFPGQ
jgi:hypothetical protein